MNRKIKLLSALLLAVSLSACTNNTSTPTPSTPTPTPVQSTPAPSTPTPTPVPSTPVPSTTTPIQTTTTPVTPSTTPADVPTEYSDHAAYMAAENDTVLMVRGKATHVYGDDTSKNFYLQNGEGGFLIYEYAGSVNIEVGKNYKVIGKKTTYNGARELKEIVSVEEISDTITVTNKDISDLETVDDNALIPYHGGIVDVKGSFSQDPSTTVNDSKAYSITIMMSKKTITMRVDPKVCGDTQFAAINTLLKTAKNGQGVSFKGVATSFGYSGKWSPQIQILNSSDITITELSNDAKVELAKDSLTIPYVTKENLDLKTTIDGVSVSYSSSDTTTISNTGAVTRKAQDVEVTITATLSLGQATDTATLKTLVLGTDESKNTVLAHTGFEDTSEKDGYGNGSLKPSYKGASITIDGMKWYLDDALVGSLAGDKKIGDWAVRQKPANSDTSTAGTWTEEDYEDITFVDFYAASYSNHVPGTVVLSISKDQGTTWTEHSRYDVTDEIQQIRAYVNITGGARIKFTYTNTTQNMNLDEVSFVKVTK